MKVGDRVKVLAMIEAALEKRHIECAELRKEVDQLNVRTKRLEEQLFDL